MFKTMKYHPLLQYIMQDKLCARKSKFCGLILHVRDNHLFVKQHQQIFIISNKYNICLKQQDPPPHHPPTVFCCD